MVADLAAVVSAVVLEVADLEVVLAVVVLVVVLVADVLLPQASHLRADTLTKYRSNKMNQNLPSLLRDLQLVTMRNFPAFY